MTSGACQHPHPAPPRLASQKRPHWIPLSNQVVELLTRLRKIVPAGREYRLPNRIDPRRPIANRSLNALMERLGFGGEGTPHGMRTAFSTHFNSLGASVDGVEHCPACTDQYRADDLQPSRIPRRKARDAPGMGRSSGRCSEESERTSSSASGLERIVAHACAGLPSNGTRACRCTRSFCGPQGQRPALVDMVALRRTAVAGHMLLLYIHMRQLNSLAHIRPAEKSVAQRRVEERNDFSFRAIADWSEISHSHTIRTSQPRSSSAFKASASRRVLPSSLSSQNRAFDFGV